MESGHVSVSISVQSEVGKSFLSADSSFSLIFLSIGYWCLEDGLKKDLIFLIVSILENLSSSMFWFLCLASSSMLAFNRSPGLQHQLFHKITLIHFFAFQHVVTSESSLRK